MDGDIVPIELPKACSFPIQIGTCECLEVSFLTGGRL